MMDQQASYGERVVLHLFESIKALESDHEVTVRRNSVAAEEIDADGLVIVRDGAVTILDELLGDAGPFYKSHEIVLELMVHANRHDSDACFDWLCRLVTETLEGDDTFGGLIHGLSYQPPSGELVAIDGAPSVKGASLPVTVEYQTNTRY